MFAATTTKAQRRTGMVLTGLAAAFLLMDAGMKLLQASPAIKGTTDLGYPASAVFGLGVLQLACLVLYVIPRTSLLGAILLTGWLGGAIASHVRVGNPLFSHELFPVYVGALVWGGLYLRDGRLRILLLTRAAA